ncbi:MAG: hypothetical protein K6B17_09380 [Treponema sp.]|jgi:hypothetical protein|nr:hypothetical protein [Treponema sp.]
MVESDNPKKNSASSNTAKGLMGKALRFQKQGSTSMKQTANVITEKNGIFTISQSVETESVVQDPKLKALVDSVLK